MIKMLVRRQVTITIQTNFKTKIYEINEMNMPFLNLLYFAVPTNLICFYWVSTYIVDLKLLPLHINGNSSKVYPLFTLLIQYTIMQLMFCFICVDWTAS